MWKFDLFRSRAKKDAPVTVASSHGTREYTWLFSGTTSSSNIPFASFG